MHLGDALSFPCSRERWSGQRLAQEWTIGRLRDTLMEDAFQHEKIQQGLASRARSEMVMQDEEITIRHFHEVIEREMSRP